MELGIYSFGDSSIDPETGNYVSERQLYKNLLERITLADEVGLNYFGLGEHHRADYPLSAPVTLLSAAAAVTKQIHLGSAVTVLPTDDPVRVFEQYASLDLISDGRAEVTVGTGAFCESYDLFGHERQEIQPEFTEKLHLLKELNHGGAIDWNGTHRPPFSVPGVWPRPSNGELDLWVATGATPESSERAAQLGMNAIYSFLGNPPASSKHLVDHYRAEAVAAGHDLATMKVGVAGRGLVASNSAHAKETMYQHWLPSVVKVSEERGKPIPDRELYEEQATSNGPIIVGTPNEVADRLAAIHEHLQHDRHILHMDIGNVPHADVMKSIELFGTEVLPQVAHLGFVTARV